MKTVLFLLGVGCVATISKAAEFQTIGECVAGKAVTTKAGLNGKVIGIDKMVPTLKCKVMMDRTGQAESYIYWDLSPAGGVTRNPDHVTQGPYSCVTFAGIINHGGRVEVRPLWDVQVTGPNSYIGSDRKPGAFTYDPARGLVQFTSGAMKDQVARYVAQGGGQFIYKGENGEIDCGLDKK